MADNKTTITDLDRLARNSITIGSASLLAALEREHPRILRLLRNKREKEDE